MYNKVIQPRSEVEIMARPFRTSALAEDIARRGSMMSGQKVEGIIKVVL